MQKARSKFKKYYPSLPALMLIAGLASCAERSDRHVQESMLSLSATPPQCFQQVPADSLSPSHYVTCGDSYNDYQTRYSFQSKRNKSNSKNNLSTTVQSKGEK